MLFVIYNFILNKYTRLKLYTLSFLYFILVRYVDLYSYILLVLTKYLPCLILVKTYLYKNFNIYEYKCNFKQRFYTIKFIEYNKVQSMCNFIRNIDKNIQDRNLIFNASLQDNGVYIKDVTEDLRSYFHYIEFNRGSSEDLILKLRGSDVWEYVRYSINFIDKYELLVSLNDDDMTDLVFKD